MVFFCVCNMLIKAIAEAGVYAILLEFNEHWASTIPVLAKLEQASVLHYAALACETV